jgi:hypothetical protein
MSSEKGMELIERIAGSTSSSATSSRTLPVLGRKGMELMMAESPTFSAAAKYATASIARRPLLISLSFFIFFY